MGMKTNHIISLYLTLCMMLVLSSCITSDGLSKSERRNLLSSQVAQSLSNRHFTIDVSAAHPTGYPSVILQSQFSLTVEGDTLKSYLPYFGTAHFAVPYGGGNPLHFTSTITEYEETLLKPGEHLIKLTTYNNDDKYIFSIDVFDNGRATVNVLFYNRSNISFNGEMNFE